MELFPRLNQDRATTPRFGRLRPGTIGWRRVESVASRHRHAHETTSLAPRSTQRVAAAAHRRATPRASAQDASQNRRTLQEVGAASALAAAHGAFPGDARLQHAARQALGALETDGRVDADYGMAGGSAQLRLQVHEQQHQHQQQADLEVGVGGVAMGRGAYG